MHYPFYKSARIHTKLALCDCKLQQTIGKFPNICRSIQYEYKLWSICINLSLKTYLQIQQFKSIDFDHI